LRQWIEEEHYLQFARIKFACTSQRFRCKYGNNIDVLFIATRFVGFARDGDVLLRVSSQKIANG
jgi:hypothetical protein